MAEIIPKVSKEEPGILFYLAVLIFALNLIFYFVFFTLEKRTETIIETLEARLKEPPEIAQLKEKLISYERKIQNFSFILERHTFPSKIFKFLEERTHPKVFIKNFEFSLNPTSTIRIIGETDNFFTLGQQLLVFQEKLTPKEPNQERPKIFNLELGQLNITKDQKVEFELRFNFDKEIIKPEIRK